MCKKSLWITGLLVLLAACSFSQARPTQQGPPSPSPVPQNLPSVSLPRQGPKPYKEVITDKAVSQKGLFTVHKVEDKYFFEIPDSIMGRELLAVTRFIRLPANIPAQGFPTYGGDETNEQTLVFEKGPSNNVFLRAITLINTADSSNVIYKAVTNSNLNTIVAAFPIAALSRDSGSVVIDVTDFFKGDNQVVGISPATKRSFSLTALAPDRSYISIINSFPINTEIRTVKTYFASPSLPGPSPFPSSVIPAAQSAGAVTVELNTSLLLLPTHPMPVRYWDRRVGFFPDQYTVFSDNQQEVRNLTMAVRWRLEPKPEDLEKWKRGELVEPQKPIVYYIDPATPRQWRKYLIAGINDWQAAFEKAGFKNAIVGKEWPNDPKMSMEDARYSVLRYFASDVANARGPNIHDPRSGEILESHIAWYHNVMQLVHDWYMVQASIIDPRARKMVFDEELMGQLIRFVSSHEVGHTLGLLHNMGSSSRTPVENLRNKAWVEANGHTASIMDYARFNYVAQPEDHIGSSGIYPRIGDYDKWAIRWGYGFIPGQTADEQKSASNKLIIQTLQDNPRTYFNTYELGNPNDPHNLTEDLGDNAVKASEYGIKNLKRIIPNLDGWTKVEGEPNGNLARMYGQVVGQFRRYINHVAASIGGIYETPKTADQEGSIYSPVPKAVQKGSFAFINSQLFTTPSWLLDKAILNKITQPTTTDPVGQLQLETLGNLLSPARLTRLVNSAERFGPAVYTADELMTDVKNGIWSELKTHAAVSLQRRALQKAYVDILGRIINPPASPFDNGSNPGWKDTDLPSLARGYLVGLQKDIKAAEPLTSDKMTRMHLADVSSRIKNILDPKAS